MTDFFLLNLTGFGYDGDESNAMAFIAVSTVSFSCWKYWTYLSCSFLLLRTLLPRFENNDTLKYYCNKNCHPEEKKNIPTFWFIVVFYQGDKFLLKFHYFRISSMLSTMLSMPCCKNSYLLFSLNKLSLIKVNSSPSTKRGIWPSLFPKYLNIFS